MAVETLSSQASSEVVVQNVSDLKVEFHGFNFSYRKAEEGR